MPVPNSAQIASLVKVNDIPPPHNQKFSMVLGTIVSDAFSNFVKLAQIMPGIKTSAMPPANTGTTLVPGTLVVPSSSSAMLLMEVSRKTKSLGLDDGQQKTLDNMLAEGLSLGLDALSSATMLPGVVVTANVTASPGKLMAPQVSLLQMQVEQKLRNMAPKFHIPAAPVFGAGPGVKGACLPKDPASVIAGLIGKSSVLFVDSVTVAPGIQCAPGMTVGTGRLI